MVSIRVVNGAAEVSTHSSEPDVAVFATAIVEARGALLRWDITSNERFPDAEIIDPVAADAWLRDVYGSEVAAAARSIGAESVTVALPDDTELVDAARQLALLGWARAWWPAGFSVPPLNPMILAAETALASSAVEHLLDDDEAVERALVEAKTAPAALADVPEPLSADASSTTDSLVELAETYGVELDAVEVAVSESRDEWALAAGGTDGPVAGIDVANGAAPVRWTDVPAQIIAADADARWTLRQVSGVAVLHVAVPAVPDTPGSTSDTASLRARFGSVELGIDVALKRAQTEFTGATEVPASALFLPADERVLWVRDPRMGTTAGAAESAETRALVRDFAGMRLTLPDASLAERAAGLQQ